MSVDRNLKIIIGMTYTEKELIEILKPRKIKITEYKEVFSSTCGKCKRENNNDALFCIKCGNKLKDHKWVTIEDGEELSYVVDEFRDYFYKGHDLIFDEINHMAEIKKYQKQYYLGYELYGSDPNEWESEAILLSKQDDSIEYLKTLLIETNNEKWLNSEPQIWVITEVF